MNFRKTLFFEIPSKDFIMPVYTEDDVNTLKSFLADDEVLFSIGLKSEESKDGYYYIGQVKDFTEKFLLGDFPLIYRKRVLDVLNGLLLEPKYISFDGQIGFVKKIVYFQMTKNGPKSFLTDFSEKQLTKLERLGIQDYYVKEIPAFIISNHLQKETYTADEIFYQVKNPNY